EIYTNGDVRPCVNSNEPIGNINQENLDDILRKSKVLQRMKKNMLMDMPDTNCVLCHHRTIEEEDFGYLRDDYNSRLVKNKDIDYDDIENFDLRTIDLHWSNICNLRCIMCNPGQSSLIAKDQKTFVTPVNAKSIEKIISMVKENQDKMKEIYLSGGEPFYIPHNVKLLEELSNKNVPIRINTNMHWKINNRLLALLKTFKNVQLTISADALNKRFNYIRNGADWEVFKYNLDYIQDETHFDIRINTIFSIINADSICNTIDFFYNKKNIKDISINLLYEPKALDARNYPEDKKSNIISAIEKLISIISSEHTNLINNLRNCIMQIKLPNQRDYRKSLNEITQRNTIPWQDVFPDLV
ncbi:MAG: twitch domain-containing radical SAM protein, partial [SAR202 cluster bacterium]|nr:twitch domain-containing radical SAM protein [SAR202 cluster bacterium]